ncbi:MAG: putative metal-binding motif-containing protein [Deltaproteobacteria bacterium]|nr:putative metal-binding motif-containing protein [Deltaproteobacteria bacterium]
MPSRPVLLLAALALLAAPACRGTLTVDGYTPGGSDDDDASGDDDDSVDPNDMDGDGDPADTDCDDNDPTAYNGADENCGDGVDNDCDPSTLCYEASVGDNIAFIQPIENTLDAADWYRSAGQGVPPFMNSDNMLIALHRRSGERDLSLVFVIDAIEDGSGGQAEVIVEGVEGAELLIEDDPGEGFVDDDEAYFFFQWVSCCVDGAVIGPLEPDLCISIDVNQADNLDGFGVVDREGEQPLGSTNQRLQLCATQ